MDIENDENVMEHANQKIQKKKPSHQLTTLLIKQFPIPLIWSCFSDHLLDLLCGTTIWLVGDAHWCMFLWFWCWILYELLGVHCVSTLVSQIINLSTMELLHIDIYTYRFPISDDCRILVYFWYVIFMLESMNHQWLQFLGSWLLGTLFSVHKKSRPIDAILRVLIS